MTYQLTKLQTKQVAEGFNLKASLHNEGKSDAGKSPKGAWIARGYNEARTQIFNRQMAPGSTKEEIMAPLAPITAETAQAVWDAADVRLQAAMAAHKARVDQP